MIPFDVAHKAVHYPEDRRFRIWIRPSILTGIAIAIAGIIAAAWIEVVIAGLPRVPAIPQVYPNNFAGPHGFPVWLRYCHFFNFLFVMMLIRSGLSILMDHPRLYFNDGCAPGTEWIRFTPLKVPRDRLWTAKDGRRRSVQSQADSGLPTQLIPVAFRRVNHTFLYLYPRDR
jgi:methionine sulfoxide reductase catalytic subunit